MAKFGGGGFRSYKAENMSSIGIVESSNIVNNGESHRLFAIGSSNRKMSASNISRVYGTEVLSMIPSLVRC